MKGYWFCAHNDRLGYADGRVAAVGVTHQVDGPPGMCRHSLYASRHVADALKYAPGPILYRVKLGGEIVQNCEEAAGTRCTYLARIDATDVLRRYARLCALDVIHLWDAPKVVECYLRTSKESLRDAAKDAAWAALGDTAWAIWAIRAVKAAIGDVKAARTIWAAWAARDTTGDAKAARATEDVRNARATAWAARAAASAAANAARAARAAAWAKQRRRLARMVNQEFRQCKKVGDLVQL